MLVSNKSWTVGSKLCRSTLASGRGGERAISVLHHWDRVAVAEMIDSRSEPAGASGPADAPGPDRGVKKDAAYIGWVEHFRTAKWQKRQTARAIAAGRERSLGRQ